MTPTVTHHDPNRARRVDGLIAMGVSLDDANTMDDTIVAAVAAAFLAGQGRLSTLRPDLHELAYSCYLGLLCGTSRMAMDIVPEEHPALFKTDKAGVLQ